MRSVTINIRSRRGLTFVELTIGMAITAVLMLALASFAFAVSAGWRQSEQQFRVRSVGTQSVAQLRNALSDSLCVILAKPGDNIGNSAYLFCWHTDTWNGAADRKTQFGEVSLIEFDPPTKTIWLYETKDVSAMTAAEKTTAADETWVSATADQIVSFYKSSTIHKPRVPLVGGAMSSGGAQVNTAQFGYFAATNGKPVATYQLAIVTDDALATASDNVALRAAQTPTNLPTN